MTSTAHSHDADAATTTDHDVVIHIDRRRFEVGATLTGAELRQLGGLGSEVDLFLEEHGDADDRPIGDEELVHLRNGMHFFSTPRNITPGSCPTS
jgi:hypothetical protein